MQGDFAVKACSQEVSIRQTVAATGIAFVSEVFFTGSLPRAFVQLTQTTLGVAGTFAVEWAIRLNAAGTPDFLPLSTGVLIPGIPVNQLLTTGAVWLRFTVTAAKGENVEIAATAFL